MKKVSVRIKGGKFQIETTGFTGPACTKATERLELRLGAKVTDTPTPEMFESEVVHEQE